MTNHSSAQASIEYIQYLRIVLNENQSDISQEQYQKITAYLDDIERVLQELYQTKDQAMNVFLELSIKVENTNNESLKARIKEIDPQFTDKNDRQTTIISELTSDLDVVIKNIRACLSCKEK